jgi:hypothetical protein
LRKSILRDYGLKIPPSRKQNTGHQRICRWYHSIHHKR